MQYTKNICFINENSSSKTSVILLDKNFKILQYKILNKHNDSKIYNIYCGIIEKVDYRIESLFVRVETDVIGFLPFRHLNSVFYDRHTHKLLKKFQRGDKILVQVIRDSIDSKALKLTNNIAISSVFSVLLPFSDEKHGISGNIKADQRIFIKQFLDSLNISGSLIIRTSATESSFKDLEEDLISINKIFQFVLHKFTRVNSFALLFKNDELIHVLRSYSLYLVDTVLVRSKEMFNLLSDYNAQNFIKFPAIVMNNDLKFLKAVQNQIDTLHKNEVALPSNGSVIFEKTQAMITVDVNSKKCTLGKNMAETAFKINLEAVDVIVDQIILRNLGGLIAIDLIDMQDISHVNAVFERFKQAFKRDTASIKLLPINSLYVLQLSRERKGLSLWDLNYESCENCSNGLVPSLHFLADSFLLELSFFDKKMPLLLHVDASLFNFLFKHYVELFRTYSKLNWQIISKGFAIYEAQF